MSEESDEIERLRNWVNDLQSGIYINCVYCGHRYGPNDEVPATMADALKEHIEQCPEHPMSHLKATLREAVKVLDQWDDNTGESLHSLLTNRIGDHDESGNIIIEFGAYHLLLTAIEKQRQFLAAHPELRKEKDDG